MTDRTLCHCFPNPTCPVCVTRVAWESRRIEMINWLVDQRKFSRGGAERCVKNFIESVVFVAEETNTPMVSR